MPGAHVVALGWGWRHAARLQPALAGVDLEIEPGERVLLLGPSGGGKSTLLAALAGVIGGEEDGDETGELLVDGVHPRSQPGVAGLVQQDPQANTIMARVGDDVAFGCENLRVPREEIWPRVRAALDAVGLDVPLDRDTHHLSGGERQRLALAGVLAMRPGLILLDEPTANLDPEGVVEVRDAVARVCAETGATLIVVEHRVSTWLPMIDRVVVVEPGGGVRTSGSPDVVLASSATALADDGIWVPGLPVVIDRPATRAAAEPEPLLTAYDVAIGRARTRLHGGIDGAIHAGTSTVITGPNGAGKSTLALTLGGLLAPIEGEVRGRADFAPRRSPHPHRWRSRELLTRLGTVFQQPEHQFVASTVRAELEVGPHVAGRPASEVAARVDELLDALHLVRLAEAHPFSLSGGERRRLSVATAMATSPRVLLFDEPTYGQDRRTWRELVRLMSELVADGTAIVSVTHDAELVAALGDHRIELSPHGASIGEAT